MVAYVAATDLPFACLQLKDIEGLEILDIAADNTKILLLLDNEDEFIFHNSLKKIQALKMLQSLSYAAHYSEEAISEPSKKD